MTKKELNKCITIARKVRKWAVDNWYVSDLCGMCGIASYVLCKKLIKAGIKANIACNKMHAFVQSNGYIVDITATQFDKEPIMIRKQKKREEEWWRVFKTFNKPDDFIAYQKRVGWPEMQIYDACNFTR